MALGHSGLSELAAALKSGEVGDLVREAVRLVCQELIEVEATAQIGAGLYERSETRPPTGPGRLDICQRRKRRFRIVTNVNTVC